mgnify:CR=1 FL=1
MNRAAHLEFAPPTPAGGVRSYGMALMHVVLLQWLIGVSNVWLQWPLSLAVLHNTGAALVLAVVLVTALRLSRSH